MSERHGQRWGWYLLLIIPFIATLFPQIYASATPTLWGFPFFYWWQLLWIVLTALITAFVFWLTPEEDAPEAQGEGGAAS